MALFENFPYTNLHNLNLDWVMEKIKTLDEKFDKAIAAKIKFADPVEWDITKPYDIMTIVMYDNAAYLSMQPVPPGTLITDTDYWQNIFDMQELYDKIDNLDDRLSDEIDQVDEKADQIDNAKVDKFAPTNIVDANNPQYTGYALLSDSTVAHLPTSNTNVQYHVFFLDDIQLAFKHDTNGANAYYVRYYTNNQWYSWKEVEMKDSADTAITTLTNLINNSTSALDTAKVNKYAAIPVSDMDNYNLTGYALLQDITTANLPTANGQYYEVFFLDNIQLIFNHGASGATGAYVRYYANDHWYPWKPLAMQDNVIPSNNIKHILFIGDSYSTYYNNQLYNTFVNNVGIPSAQCHNISASGAGFSIAQTVTFQQAMENYTGDKSIITDIIVCGGINDALIGFSTDVATARSTVTNAIDSFVTSARNLYPNAKLHIAYVGGCLPTSSYYTSLHPNVSQEWAFWCYTIYAAGAGFNVLKAWNAIHSSPYNYASDGLHPSQDIGAVAIGQALASVFNNNPVIYNRPIETLVFNATGFNVTDIQLYVDIKEDMAIVSIPEKTINVPLNTVISGDTWYPVWRMDAFQVRNPIFLPITGWAYGFNNLTYEQKFGELRIADGVISIRFASAAMTATLDSNQSRISNILTSFTVPLFNCN